MNIQKENKKGITMKNKLLCYDNGGATCDRYTIMPPKSAFEYRQNDGTYLCLACDESPYHPLGIGMSATGTHGKHLGKRIQFNMLQSHVKRLSQLFFPMFC